MEGLPYLVSIDGHQKLGLQETKSRLEMNKQRRRRDVD